MDTNSIDQSEPTDTLPDSSFSPAITGKTGPKSSSPPIIRDRKGQFRPGSHANPNGRPKSRLNHATLLAQSLLQEAAPDIARRLIQVAKSGNATALKLALERLLPRAHDRRLELELTPPTRRPTTTDDGSPADYTPEDILLAHNKLVESVAGGELSPTEAHAISQLLEARRRSWEVLQFKRRLSALEKRAAESRDR